MYDELLPHWARWCAARQRGKGRSATPETSQWPSKLRSMGIRFESNGPSDSGLYFKWVYRDDLEDEDIPDCIPLDCMIGGLLLFTWEAGLDFNLKQHKGK